MTWLVTATNNNTELGVCVQWTAGLQELVVHALQSLKDLRALAEEAHHFQDSPTPAERSSMKLSLSTGGSQGPDT